MPTSPVPHDRRRLAQLYEAASDWGEDYLTGLLAVALGHSRAELPEHLREALRDNGFRGDASAALKILGQQDLRLTWDPDDDDV